MKNEEREIVNFDATMQEMDAAVLSVVVSDDHDLRSVCGK
jgi:hypothetical protein